MFLKVWKTIGNKLCALFVKEAKDLVLGGFQKKGERFGKIILRRRLESEILESLPLHWRTIASKSPLPCSDHRDVACGSENFICKTADSLIVALNVSPKPLLCSLVTHKTKD